MKTRCTTAIRYALMLLALVLVPAGHAWGSHEHSHISATAFALLNPVERAVLEPEAAALAQVYSNFPDENWPAYGEWGNGVADPRQPRFPDTRREWDISHYLGWNPVTQEGRSYPHRPPQSFECVPWLFRQAIEAIQAGRLEDSARHLGSALHYIQDSGAFGHLQSIHRSFHWKNLTDVRPDGYRPQVLGKTPEAAAAGLQKRLQGLVTMTEERVGVLLEKVQMPMAEVKRLSATNPFPEAAARAVQRTRELFPDDRDATVRACAAECAHVSADAMRTLLAFAPQPFPAPASPPLGKNLVFNPSFEQAGDGTPAGWCAGWLDLEDRAGRIEQYRGGTHWEKPVKSGRYSALLLWSPVKGLEWRQTWRHAVRVSAGEAYRATAWVRTRTDAGTASVVLEFSDAAYHEVSRVSSQPLGKDSEWTQLISESAVPKEARWLRLVLRSDASGAAWFDDVEITRRPAANPE